MSASRRRWWIRPAAHRALYDALDLATTINRRLRDELATIRRQLDDAQQAHLCTLASLADLQRRHTAVLARADQADTAHAAADWWRAQYVAARAELAAMRAHLSSGGGER